ncbi:hypothetical protein IE53DRAFT_384330 [Violaceomyces palustris]|uniref:Uncharacterized protein n=1 Tax=Violaceomyces palustris TaxID=1673888 RepID=A0ACD0P5A2_9BASI|nr:hypothetical protein IE53DRAFT_384330 [Violaceomyces palustris]
MNLPISSLKHIASISIQVAPRNTTKASRSLRLLLARLPSKAPPGIDLPKTSVKILPGGSKEERVEVIYKNKSQFKLDLRTTSPELSLNDLIRKVEAPARVLRLKEEGL